MCYVITLATPPFITHSSKAPYNHPVRERESNDNSISIYSFLSLAIKLSAPSNILFLIFVCSYFLLFYPFFIMVLPSIYQLAPSTLPLPHCLPLSVSLSQHCQLCRWYSMLQYIWLWKNKGIPWAGSERRV